MELWKKFVKFSGSIRIHIAIQCKNLPVFWDSTFEKFARTCCHRNLVCLFMFLVERAQYWASGRRPRKFRLLISHSQLLMSFLNLVFLNLRNFWPVLPLTRRSQKILRKSAEATFSKSKEFDVSIQEVKKNKKTVKRLFVYIFGWAYAVQSTEQWAGDPGDFKSSDSNSNTKSKP